MPSRSKTANGKPSSRASLSVARQHTQPAPMVAAAVAAASASSAAAAVAALAAAAAAREESEEEDSSNEESDDDSEDSEDSSDEDQGEEEDGDNNDDEDESADDREDHSLEDQESNCSTAAAANEDHRNFTPTSISTNGSMPPHSCPQCPFTCHSGGHMRRHLEEHEEPSMIYCPFCPYQIEYHRKRNFRTHLFIHLDEDLKCFKCNFKTKSMESFQTHLSKHDFIFECAECPHRTKHRADFIEHCAKHKARATKHKKLLCVVCGTRQSSTSSYSSHLMAHYRQEQRLTCLPCGYSTDKIRGFKRHLLVTHHLEVNMK